MKPPRPGPLNLRLSPVERETLESAARADGVPLSTYIKAVALKVAEGKAIVLAGPVADLLREQAALRGMEPSYFAALILARFVG